MHAHRSRIRSLSAEGPRRRPLPKSSKPVSESAFLPHFAYNQGSADWAAMAQQGTTGQCREGTTGQYRAQQGSADWAAMTHSHQRSCAAAGGEGQGDYGECSAAGWASRHPYTEDVQEDGHTGWTQRMDTEDGQELWPQQAQQPSQAGRQQHPHQRTPTHIYIYTCTHTHTYIYTRTHTICI